jgi:signal transduction histidine kinase
MTILDLFAAVLFFFGAFAFGLSFVGLLGELRGRRIGSCEIVDVAITLACFAWFLVNTLLILAPLRPGLQTTPLWAVFLLICYLFPGLIMSSSFTGVEPTVRRTRGPGWRLLIAAVYLVGLGSFGLGVANLFGASVVSNRTLQQYFNLSIPLLYIVAALFSMLSVNKARDSAESPKQRKQRRSLLLVLSSMILAFMPMALNFWSGLGYGELIALYARMLPLAFLLLFTYHESRYRFFDVLIKRGAVMLLLLVVLGGGFTLTLPWLERLEAGWAEPWIYAIVLLPLALAIPWLSRRMREWVDYVWLGRRFTTEEAVSHFLNGLRGALGEAELIDRAARRLSDIFRAPARLDLSLREAPTDFRTQVEAPVKIAQATVGAIRLGPRENDMPYFGEDVALLGSLTEVFSSLLENARLQSKKQEQEQLAQELSLQASQSELKALRAQINPHFLFNALNAIAGLIHEDPQRADRAVEHLAEVFRYTLRGSQNEWATLDQELEFVRAYLEVEKARFGARLQVTIDSEPEASLLIVPTMLLQTLVENAVKHGVATVRGPGRIEILTLRRGGSLIIEVADNGPGFAEAALDPASGDSGRGYGLANVERRLKGHFDDEASLSFRRDEERGLTRVSIDLPIARLRGSGPSASASDVSGAASS